MDESGVSARDEFNLQVKTKADIKNALPADIYECVARASLLKSDFLDEAKPADRHVKDFYKSFDTIFQFTQLSVSEKLRRETREWLKIKKKMMDPEHVLNGVALFYDYYSELTKLGIGKMFDDPVIPPIGIERLLMDKTIEEQLREEMRDAQRKREFEEDSAIDEGDI